jgi:hypothetical protein
MTTDEEIFSWLHRVQSDPFTFETARAGRRFGGDTGIFFRDQPDGFQVSPVADLEALPVSELDRLRQVEIDFARQTELRALDLVMRGRLIELHVERSCWRRDATLGDPSPTVQLCGTCREAWPCPTRQTLDAWIAAETDSRETRS